MFYPAKAGDLKGQHLYRTFFAMAIIYILLLMLPICKATTDRMTTTEFATSLLSPTTTSMYNFSCYGCFGVVGEVTKCGESLTADEDFDAAEIVPCNTVCTKAVSYQMDMKIFVTRNCSATCDPGCTVRGGTGTCWYCCHGNLCNGAGSMTVMPLCTRVFWVFAAFFLCKVLT